jgi:DNA polymerase-3 subunit epsilon
MKGWKGFRPGDVYRYDIREALALIQKRRTLCAFDVEHCGTRSQDIVEIGAIRVDGDVEAVFHEMLYLDPRQFSPYARRRTGIRAKELRAGGDRVQTLRRFREFLGDAVPVLHAALDDIRTLNLNLKRHGIRIAPRQAVDVQLWGREVFECEQLTLEGLARRFDAAQPTHRALDDARATLAVFRGMLAEAGAGNF